MALITAAGKEGSKAFETAEHEEQMLTFFWLTAAKCFFVFFFDLFVLTSLSPPVFLHSQQPQHESLASPIDRRSDYYRRVAACEK